MKKILFLIIVLFTNLFMLTAQEVELSFNPAKGATYTYSYDIKQTIDQQVMGMDIQTLQNISMVYTMAVLNKSKETVRVEFEYKDIFYELVNPSLVVRYDSNNPIENPNQMEETMAKMYNCLIGRTFEAVIALNGTVESLTGMDEVIDDMLLSMNLEEGQAAGIEDMLRKQMSNEALKKEFEQSLKIYPEGKVKAGDRWTLDHTVDIADIKLYSANQYELSRIDKKEVVLSVESVIDSPGENGLKGTQTGVSYLDRKTGMPKKATLYQDVKGEVTLYGMTIPMKVLSSIDITIQKK